MSGWIKLHRKFCEKAFYSKDSEKVHLWVHLLMSANHAGKEELLGGKPFFCVSGQFTTGRKQLSSETGISESKIERILTYFEKIEQQIEQQKTSTNRLISILNWGQYQQSEQQIEQRVNNDRTTSEQQVNNDRTHLKNERKKEREEIKEEESLSPAIAPTPSTPKPPKFDFKAELIKIGVSEQVASEYMAVRKTKRATNTKTAFDDIEAQITKTGKTAQECIAFAVKKSWAGFEASWMDNAEKTAQKTGVKVGDPRFCTDWSKSNEEYHLGF